MNYRDMLLQDYFDESYDDYDAFDEEIKYDGDSLADIGKMNVRLQELQKASRDRAKAKFGKKYDASKLDDTDEIKKLKADIADTKSARQVFNAYANQYGGAKNAPKSARGLFNGATDASKIASMITKTNATSKDKKQNVVNYEKITFNGSKSATKKARDAAFTGKAFKNSPEYTALKKRLKRENPNLNDQAIDHMIDTSGAAEKWVRTKQSDKKAKDRFNAGPKDTQMTTSYLMGSRDAASGAAPSPEKVSKFKAASDWASGHKKQLAIAGGAAAGVAGAGVTASGVKSIADLKNTAKAKAAWKASGSNLPFEEWRKKQLTKAGIKTGIGAALTAAGAGGAAYAGLSKKFNEAEDLMFQYELVELEEAYLEGYYGQVIAENMGFDSEYDLVCYAESMDSYDDYDEDFDEDFALPYFG